MNLKAGVIGLGEIGRQHARVLASLDGVDFVGSCDIDPSREIYGQGRPVYKNVVELLNLGLDYAVVAVPSVNHLEVAQELAINGVHALIEKPLAHNSQSAEQICHIFYSNSIIGAVGHIEVFNPAVQVGKSMIGKLGKIYQVSTQRRGQTPARIKDVGVIFDLASHDIQMTNWITEQKYATVSAQILKRKESVYEDMVVAVGKLSDESIFSHHVDWVSPIKKRSLLITGESGAIEIDTLGCNLTFYQNGLSTNSWDEAVRLKGISEGNATKFAISKTEPLVLEHQSFRDVVTGKLGIEKVISLRDGLSVVRIAELILKSGQSNGVLSLLKD